MSKPDPGTLESLLAADPAAVLTLDESGRIVELNPAAEAVLGTGRAQALGRPISELVISGRSRGRFERGPHYRAIRADGTELPLELAVARTQEAPVRFSAWIHELPEPRDVEPEPAQRKALLERAERLSHIGSWLWTPETRELLWSENLFRLFGLEPREVAPCDDLLLARTHPEDRPRFEAAIEAARLGGELPLVEVRIVRPDGAVRHLRATGAVEDTAPGSSRTLVGSVQDVTEQRRAEAEIAAYLAVSEALARWSSLEEGAERLLQDLLAALGFAVGVLWLPDGDALVPRVFYSAPTVSAPEFEDATFELRFPSGDGLPGQAWRDHVPVDFSALSADRHVGRRESAARDSGIRSALAIPAVFGEHVLAVVELWSTHPSELTSRLTRLMTGVGYELGAFLNRRRAELVAPVLTARQLEILELASQGLSTPDIAAELVVARSTVKSHFEHIYDALGVSDRAAAVAQAFRQGLIE